MNTVVDDIASRFGVKPLGQRMIVEQRPQVTVLEWWPIDAPSEIGGEVVDGITGRERLTKVTLPDPDCQFVME